MSEYSHQSLRGVVGPPTTGISRAVQPLVRAVALVLLVGPHAAAATMAERASIAHSKHNLSVTGPGPIKSPAARSICIFCHASHKGANAPLWNRFSSGVTYVPYGSTTTKATIGQPTGASKLCLSCHDGTVALGMVRSRRQRIPFAGGVDRLSTERPSVLRTDLSDDHPISFIYDKKLAEASNGELLSPDGLTGPVRLDKEGRLQCTSCHNAHDSSFGKFLVMHNRESALCMSCHDKKYWTDSVHRTSAAKWNGTGSNPWPRTSHANVAANGCENCHRPHSAETKQRLLSLDGEEENCYSCHKGSVAGRNIEKAFGERSRHPVSATSGLHDPTEDIVWSKRHVECADCHNPHAANTARANAPYASGALEGVAGVGSDKAVVYPLKHEYELCYRCHADSVGRGRAAVNRQFPQTNTRLEFRVSNESYHPVEGAGRNSDVPSLLDPLRESSVIYCTDCHNSNNGPRAGGKGADGPHGSAWSPILERQMVFTDYSKENSSSYALCYKCHSRRSILGDESFPLHGLHVGTAETSCTTCHDPHGVKTAPHLLNFNVDYVKPSESGVMEFEDEGDHKGSCSLTCHEKNHDPESY